MPSREKEIKGRRREKKIELIEADNSGWADLAGEWFGWMVGKCAGFPTLRWT